MTRPTLFRLPLTHLAALASLCASFMFGSALASSLSDLSNQDASRGIKGALTEGASSAIEKLGVPGGFANDPRVRIPLPPTLEEVAKGMRFMGRGNEADELEAAMNKAAEDAVSQAKPLMIDAVRSMSLRDAKDILTGGENSVTQFFKEKTAAPLALRFLPIVKESTDKVGLAQKYDRLAGQGVKLGLIHGDAASIEQYVTNKALDALYLMIGEKERAIRQNPAEATSEIVKSVFSSLH